MLGAGIIDYNQPEWLAEFNRRGERIAELETERDRLREALERVVKLLDRPMLKDDMCLYMNNAIRVASWLAKPPSRQL